MPVFSKITTTLSAVLALTSVVHAAPLQPAPAPEHNYQLSTHRRHVGASNVEFVSYHPPSSYKTFHDRDRSLLSRSSNATHLAVRAPAGPSGVSPEVEEAALSYLSEQIGLARDSFKVRSGYTNDIGTTHVYLIQMLNGIPVINGVANISFDKTGKVIAFGSNMVKPDQISPATPSFPQSSAIQSAEKALGIAHYDAIPATLTYVIQPAPSGTDPNRKWAMLTHQFQLRNADSSKWVQAYVDATNPKKGDVLRVVNFVAEAAYNVVEWSQQDPTWSGFKLLTDPQDTDASPKGWHEDSAGSHTDTRGNNVISYFGGNGHSDNKLTTQQSSDGLVFNYTWNPYAAPSYNKNMDVARTNAFYVTNKYHDTLYKYGFTEAAYNFQDVNYSGEAAGSDWVEMQVQAPGQNDANFATPPDGQPGHCNIFLWNATNPMRDGDLANDILTHELTHGLTNRLVGGGTSKCLQTLEARGLGEGWSDTLAFWSEQNSTAETPYAFGAWVHNNPKGLRSVLYSTDMSIDPYRYSTIGSLNEEHAIGEVWATILIEVYWTLVRARGFNPDNTKASGTEGNVVFLQILVDGLTFTPCSPTFLQARNAIIQASTNRYNNQADYCTLWRAFAKRGMGYGAANYHDDFTVPQNC